MTDTPDTDDADVSQLETRIDELEATIRKMLPSRREALGMGVAGLAGASLMSGTASAGSAQVGTIGDNSNLVDLVAEDVTITDTLNTASLSGAAAGEALLSDGSGNLTFGSGGGGILRNGSEIDYVALDVSNLPATTGSGDVALVTASNEYLEDTQQQGTPFSIVSSQKSLDGVGPTHSTGTTGITFNNDGSKLFEVSRFDQIIERSLSTPFDVTTASTDHTISSQDGEPQGIVFNNSGSKLYEVGRDSDQIYQYDLSAAFDITSASFQTSISTQNSSPRGIFWNDDGSKLYEIDSSSDEIYQLNVSTNFDITTASFDKSISSTSSGPSAITFGDNGNKMYEADQNADEIYQFTLSTPFEINTATLNATISSQDGPPNDIIFNNDGSKMYELDKDNSEIYQFTLSTGGWQPI